MSKEVVIIDDLYNKVRTILDNGRNKAYKAVNFAMVESYWNVGREIVEDEQNGENRAKYGKYILKELSAKLTKDFGEGYSITNLKYMRRFFMAFQKGQTLSDQLTWSHFILLLKVEKEEARNFYMIETVENNWASRELDRQINSLLYERIALSKDKEGVKELASKDITFRNPNSL